jgi:hypothetical protein
LLQKPDDDEDGASSDNQVDDDFLEAKKHIVTKSEDYPTPSKPSIGSEDSQSDDEWLAKEGVIFNVERMVEELL